MKNRRQGEGHTATERMSRRRKGLAVLPTLFTLGNLLCGFASLHYAARGGTSPEAFASDYALAGYLIFTAMIMDSLDGRMARLARATSDFGGELDSLADMVSFGVAPAFLSMRLIGAMLQTEGVAPGPYEALGPFADDLIGKLFWVIGAVYVSCTALRLARFNVQNKHGEEAHMSFTGLPSPGAAGVVAATVIFFEMLKSSKHLVGAPRISETLQLWMQSAFPYVLPVVLLTMGLLMVSRFSYAHVINQYLRGRRPFTYVVRVAVLAILAFWQPQITALLVIYLYALSAPVSWAWRNAFGKEKLILVEKAEQNQQNDQ